MSQDVSSLKRTGLATAESIQDFGDLADALNSRLADHARQDFSTVHGKWMAGKLTIYDDNPGLYDDVKGIHGKMVADWAIKVKVGNSYWLLPASQNPEGPIKVPNNIVITSLDGNGHGGGLSDGDDAPNIVYTVSCSGTLPMEFLWEVKVTGINVWSPVLISHVYNRGETVTFYQPRVEINSVSAQGSNPISTNLISGPPTGYWVNTKSSIEANIGPAADEYSDLFGYMRCRISNASIGGGTRYSDPLRFQIVDHTSC